MTTPTPTPRVAAVLLAAGESTRMGEMKALLPWISGATLIAHQASALARAAPQAVVVENERYREGRATSIVAGVRALPDGVDAVLVVSVDQPRSDALLASLREAWAAERPAFAAPSLGGRAGHPPCSAPGCCRSCSP